MKIMSEDYNYIIMSHPSLTTGFGFASLRCYIQIYNFRRVCPEICQSADCGIELNKPFRLPCGHYIGECCEPKLRNKQTSCPKMDCAHKLTGSDYHFDPQALENRFVSLFGVQMNINMF